MVRKRTRLDRRASRRDHAEPAHHCRRADRLRARRIARRQAGLLGGADGRDRDAGERRWLAESDDRSAGRHRRRRPLGRGARRCDPASGNARDRWPAGGGVASARRVGRVVAELPGRPGHRDHRPLGAARRRRPGAGRDRAPDRDRARLRRRTRRRARDHPVAGASAAVCRRRRCADPNRASSSCSFSPVSPSPSTQLRCSRSTTASASAIERCVAAAGDAARERTSYLTDAPDPDPLVRSLRRISHDLIMLARALPKPLPEPLSGRLAGPAKRFGGAAGEFLTELADALNRNGRGADRSCRCSKPYPNTRTRSRSSAVIG